MDSAPSVAERNKYKHQLVYTHVCLQSWVPSKQSSAERLPEQLEGAMDAFADIEPPSLCSYHGTAHSAPGSMDAELCCLAWVVQTQRVFQA